MPTNYDLDRMLEDIAREVTGAVQKFPGNKQQLAAKSEEDGELAKALIEHDRGKESALGVYTEAVQAAAMAIRIGLEGSQEFTYQYDPSLHDNFKATGSK